MASELVIRISGDIKNYEEALDKATKETEDLSGTLKEVAQASAAAFAVLTAEIGLSVAAYKESQQVVNGLNQALQNQGIYSKSLSKEYQNQASELQALTGISDEAIVSAQTQLQGYLGQATASKQLTQSILDLATAKKIDLSSAAEVVGKAIDGNSAALKKMGVEVDENGTKQERLIEITEKLGQRFGGQAEAANKGLGSLNKMKESFGNLQEAIGERFAPIIEKVSTFFSNLFQKISESKALTDFIVSVIGAGAVVTGLIAALSAGGVAFLAIKAAMAAAQVQMNLTSIAVRGLIGATGLGLILIIAAEIYLNWNTIWPRMQAVFAAFADNVSALLGNLGGLLKSVFTLDLDGIKQNLSGLKETLKKGFAEATKDLKIPAPEVGDDDEQNAAAKAAADKAAAEKRRQENANLAAKKASNQALLLESQRATEEEITLKKEEASLYQQLRDEDNAKNREAIQQKIDDNKLLQEQSNQDVKAQQAAFNDEILAQNEEYQALDDAQKEEFRIRNQAALTAQVQSENQIRQQAALERAQIQTKEHNAFLINQQKFGTAYATINQIMNSTIVQGTAKAFGELAALQQSSNATLKGIGKVAATAQIVIKTAESAMNIYAGFSTIPIIGPILGVAGAAAAVAFGAEQVGKVNAAADGGLLEGGIPGIDSIPVLAQQGELVVPRQNFDEVVGAVAAQRSGTANAAAPVEGSGSQTLEITLKDQLIEFIEMKLIERSRLGFSNIVVTGAS